MDFLSDYEALAAAHHLSDDQKISCILKYVSLATHDLWGTKIVPGKTTWNAFKADIEALYKADAAEAKHFNHNHLKRLIRESADVTCSGKCANVGMSGL